MSEQNPPGQPTPEEEHVEGVGPTASDEAAPPPPPEGDETAVAGDVPPPPPPAKSSHKPWIIGVAAVLVVALVAAGAFFGYQALNGEDKHSIAIPSTAGGMKRDTKSETALKQQLDAAETQFKTQFKDVAYVKSGVYNQANKDKGPEGALVFLGAKVKLSEQERRAPSSTRCKKQATSNGFKVAAVSPGDSGGKAVCASQARRSEDRDLRLGDQGLRSAS